MTWYILYIVLLYYTVYVYIMVNNMDEKKLNRILRFIEKEGGLDTTEHEALMATLNRLYIKRLILTEAQRDILGLNKNGFMTN